jgi:hypothetical protein
MRTGAVAVAVLVGAAVLAAGTAGCGAGGNGPDVVVDGTPPATPYDGPLFVPTREVDGHTARDLLLASGAAGRALECDGRIHAGTGPDGWGRRDGGDTPEEGLRLYFDRDAPELPRHGYRVERRGAGRVLYSFDVAGRTKVAVVVAEDREHRPGWGPETTAACDPSELPASATPGYETWTDRAGHRLPVAEISSAAGPEHCGRQRAHFLTLGRDEDARTYARDPHGVLDPGLLTAPYRAGVRLPSTAWDTGRRYGEQELWLTADPTTAYVRTPHGVEAWPALRAGVGCR